ncbi:MAG: sugar ABC transporter substrate-binding protein [Solirubrobacteraceae bacterium]
MGFKPRWFTADDVRKWEERRVGRREFIGIGAGVVAGGALLAGCGGSGSGSTGTATSAATSTAAAGAVGEGKTIGLILNGFNEYDQNLATGVLKALEGTKYDFVGLQGNFAAPAEVSNFETMISRKVDGIVVLPNTVQGASRGALAAKAAGIPVANLLWSEPTPGDPAYVVRVRVDSVHGGELTGKWITENTDPGGIMLVTGVPGQGFSEDITKGLRQALAQYGNGKWEIVASQPGLFTRTKAITVAQNMMTANPDAKIIFCYAAEMANGVASFLKKSDKTGMVLIGDDGNDEMVTWIKSPWMQSARYYSGAQEGRVGTEALRQYLEEDKQFPEPLDVKQGMVTKANIDTWLRDQPLSYPEFMSEVKKIG